MKPAYQYLCLTGLCFRYFRLKENFKIPIFYSFIKKSVQLIFINNFLNHFPVIEITAILLRRVFTGVNSIPDCGYKIPFPIKQAASYHKIKTIIIKFLLQYRINMIYDLTDPHRSKLFCLLMKQKQKMVNEAAAYYLPVIYTFPEHPMHKP